MVPILLLFFIGLVIFFERYLTIRRAAKYDNSLMSQVKANVLSGNLDSALAVVRSSNSALGRMLQKGLLRVGRPIKDIEGAIENVGKLEVAVRKEHQYFGYYCWYCPDAWFRRYDL
jgi:biopolymer transport protein ExbB